MELFLLGMVSGFLLYDSISSLRKNAGGWAIQCRESDDAHKKKISSGEMYFNDERNRAKSVKRAGRKLVAFLIFNAGAITGAAALLAFLWLLLIKSPLNPFGYDEYVFARELLGIPLLMGILGLGAGAWLRVLYREYNSGDSSQASSDDGHSVASQRLEDKAGNRGATGDNALGNGTTDPGVGASEGNGKRRGGTEGFWDWFTDLKRGHLAFVGLIIVVLGASGLIASIPTPLGEIKFSNLAVTDVTEKSSTTNSLLFEQVVLPRQKETSLSTLETLIEDKLDRDIRYFRWFDKELWTKQGAAYDSTQEFLDSFVMPIIQCAIHLEKEGRDKELRRLTLPVVHALRTILDGARSPDKEYSVFSDWRTFVHRAREAIDTELSLLSDKAECEAQLKAFRELTWIAPATLREMTDAPSIHTVFARLLVFTGDDRAALVNLYNKMRSRDEYVRSVFQKDINSRITIAELFYSERYPVERNMEPYLNRYDEILAIARHRSDTISDFLASCPMVEDPERLLIGCTDARQAPSCCGEDIPSCNCRKELEKMRDSYEQTTRIAKNAIAYRAAEAGLRPGSTLSFAEANYTKKPLFPPYIDTLGYVLMAQAARKDPIPEEDVRKAVRLFEEALARTQHTEGEHPATQASVDASIQEARIHLIQAKKMLGEFRGEAMPTESIFD